MLSQRFDSNQIHSVKATNHDNMVAIHFEKDTRIEVVGAMIESMGVEFGSFKTHSAYGRPKLTLFTEPVIHARNFEGMNHKNGELHDSGVIKTNWDTQKR